MISVADATNGNVSGVISHLAIKTVTNTLNITARDAHKPSLALFPAKTIAHSTALVKLFMN